MLGRPESSHFISPSTARITWILDSVNDIPRDYEHFDPPFLLNIDRVYKKIRNLTYRYLPDGTLFPIEIQTYDPFVIRECLNNAVAHQDYELGGRIAVVESEQELKCFLQ
jgi:ATP-dependent DNA helicase RecG